MSDCQHKPARPDGFFDDESRPVAIVLPEAWQPPADPALRLLLALLDAGMTCRDAETQGRAVAAIDEALAVAGDERAGEALAAVFARLPGGRRGTELKAALLGTLNLAEEAKRLNTSPQALWLAVKRLRERLLPENG